MLVLFTSTGNNALFLKCYVYFVVSSTLLYILIIVLLMPVVIAGALACLTGNLHSARVYWLVRTVGYFELHHTEATYQH